MGIFTEVLAGTALRLAAEQKADAAGVVRTQKQDWPF